MMFPLELSSKLAADLIRFITVPVMLVDIREGKIRGWNDSFTTRWRGQSPPGEKPLADYINNAETLEWLKNLTERASTGKAAIIGGKRPGQALSLTPDGMLLSVRMSVLRFDFEANLMMVISFQLLTDWFFSAQPNQLKSILIIFSGRLA